jgi:ATP-binding cassette subfamily B protein
VASALLELVPPLLLRRIVDDNLAQGTTNGLLLLAALYLAATGLAQGLGFVTTYLTAVSAQGGLNDLRLRLFAHLQRLPIAFYDRTPLGDVISRCKADVDTVDTLFSSGVVNLVADAVRLVTVVIAMIRLSPQLSLVTLLAVPPLLVITNAFRIRVRDAERANRLAVGQLNAHLQETLRGVEVIKVFHRQAAFVARFRRALRTALDVYNRATVYTSLYPPTMAILSAGIIALLLWASAWPAFTAIGISLGTLTAFVLLFQRFFAPISALGEEWQTVQSALSGMERIFQVLSLPLAEAGAPPSATATPGAGRATIAMHDVTFGYMPGQPVLQGVSLTVRPGEHLALVGRSGAGKSSMLNLLSGLYTPWSGCVSIGSQDPGSMPESDRRYAVGVVPQTLHLFSGSVRDNLTLGDDRVSHEMVKQACGVTGADAFIGQLAKGYDTVLGNGAGEGTQLSVGQRQLLTLARALVWNPPVLLLDEATAAVDSASEALFREALRAQIAGHGKAVLTVAHRLSTARDADRVIVLEAGRIIEEGAPAELAARGGHFAAMLELEAAGWEWRQEPTS